MPSRIASSLVREPVELEPRKMSAARRQRLLERDKWMCCVKGCPQFFAWPLELDHRVPLALGGSDDDDNLTAICQMHHLEKTRDDVKAIAKAKRLSSPSKRQKRKIPSRPFPSRRADNR